MNLDGPSAAARRSLSGQLSITVDDATANVDRLIDLSR